MPVWARIVLVAVCVAVLAEVKVNPFGTPFRFALGPATFNFACLIDPSLPILPAGLVTGVVVLFLRLVLSVWGTRSPWHQAFLTHFPGGLYYVFLAFFLAGLDLPRKKDRVLPLGLVLLVSDALANQVEILVRAEVRGWQTGLYFFGIFLAIGFLRATMALGLYFVVRQRHLEELKEQEQRKYREMLLLATALRNEAFFLRKSAADIERTMARSYHLYNLARTLAEGSSEAAAEAWKDLSSSALTVAKDIHEIKKDYQRIIAGLERVIDPQELGEPQKLSDLVDVAVAVNRNYARRLRKQIAFRSRLEVDGLLCSPLPLLTILNNLLNNSIEAIQERGNVEVAAHLFDNGTFLLQVTDDGVGIPPQDRDIIFEPGYTTKFKPETGEFYSGIGLTHVKGLVEELGGSIGLESGGGRTTFFIRIPSARVFHKVFS